MGQRLNLFGWTLLGRLTLLAWFRFGGQARAPLQSHSPDPIQVLSSGITLPSCVTLQACSYPIKSPKIERTLVSFILALTPPTDLATPVTALDLVASVNSLFLGSLPTVPPSLVSRRHRPPSRLLCATATDIPHCL